MPYAIKSYAKIRPRPVVKETRPSAAVRGYGWQWQKARLAYLNKHPLCVMCLAEGRTESAVVVDHIRPHKGEYELFWDKGNWQPLCKHHHNIKTAQQDGGFGHAIK